MNQLDKTQTVVHLSSKSLDPVTVSSLAKGLNFASTPKVVPVKEFLCGVELAA